MIDVVEVNKNDIIMIELDIGNLPMHKANAYMNQIADKFKSSFKIKECFCMAKRDDGNTKITIFKMVDDNK